MIGKGSPMSSSALETDLMTVSQSLDAIDTPALLIDLGVLEANLAAMAALCTGRPQRLRPHAKTHKSPIIAAMQRQAGAVGICCAKISEAEALAGTTVDDVLITTPLVGAPKLTRLAALASRIRVTTVVDDIEALAGLAEAANRARCALDVLVEIDVGQNRCGVRSLEAAADLVADHHDRPRARRDRREARRDGPVEDRVDVGHAVAE